MSWWRGNEPEILAALADGRAVDMTPAQPIAPPAGYTEEQFTADVLSLALRLAWRRAHFRPARTARGWRTAVSGDGKGFPDLILLRGPRLVVAECKMPGNKPTPDQLSWLEAFRAVPGAEVFLWLYPDSWAEIQKVLQ